MSLQRVGDQQLAETDHDWVVMIMVSKDHSNPCTIAWNKQDTQAQKIHTQSKGELCFAKDAFVKAEIPAGKCSVNFCLLPHV